MKKNNLWRIIWIIGIYAVLITILYLVITYKVKWEYKDLNDYLYFYNCSNQVCTSTDEIEDFYSKIVCVDNVCPYINEIIDNRLILNNGSKMFIYDYINGNVINDSYLSYKYSGDGIYIVVNDSNKYGIIDANGNVLVDFNYESIDDYNDGYFSFSENNLYGIANEEKMFKILPEYEDVVLINDELFAYVDNNYYYIKKMDDLINVYNNVVYDFVYSYNGIIFVVKDSVIDILDDNLNSLLLMKINTYYKYDTEKERGSLNLYGDGDYLYFSVIGQNQVQTNYKFNITNNKFENFK